MGLSSVTQVSPRWSQRCGEQSTLHCPGHRWVAITKKDSASFETFSGAGKKITCNSVVSTEYDNRVQTISKRFSAVLDNGESNSRQRRVNLRVWHTDSAELISRLLFLESAKAISARSPTALRQPLICLVQSRKSTNQSNQINSFWKRNVKCTHTVWVSNSFSYTFTLSNLI